MKIESIRIQGYRSLADLDLTPHEFTVLVGPNNAGKTNVVSSLAFLANVYGSGIKQALDRHGGFENVAFRSDGASLRTMSFEVTASGSIDDIWGNPPTFPRPDLDDFGLNSTTMRVRFRHRFTLWGQGEPLISRFHIASEELEVGIGDGPLTPLLRADRTDSRVDVRVESPHLLGWLGLPWLTFGIDAETYLARVMRPEVLPHDLLISGLQTISLVVAAFVEHMSMMQTFQFSPPACRLPTAPTPIANLGMHGDNLPALVNRLKEQPGEAWANVMENMALILPELEDIVVEPTPERLWRLDFKEVGFGNRWSSDEVSDGTIRALALFTSLDDPRSSLLAIEEPENSLHPWALRVLVSACQRVARSTEPKQILLTTHSPVLIDQLHPSEIAVVWREEGRTKLAPLMAFEPDVEASWMDGAFKLSNLLDSGLIRQTVPTP